MPPPTTVGGRWLSRSSFIHQPRHSRATEPKRRHRATATFVEGAPAVTGQKMEVVPVQRTIGGCASREARYFLVHSWTATGVRTAGSQQLGRRHDDESADPLHCEATRRAPLNMLSCTFVRSRPRNSSPRVTLAFQSQKVRCGMAAADLPPFRARTTAQDVVNRYRAHVSGRTFLVTVCLLPRILDSYVTLSTSSKCRWSKSC